MEQTIAIQGINTTLFERSPAYLCKLDQIELLNSLEKFPKLALWLSVLVIALYILYFYWKPKGEIGIGIVEAIPKLNFLIGIAITYILIYSTLNISSAIHKKYVEPIMMIIVILGVVYIIYNERHRLKEMMQKQE